MDALVCTVPGPPADVKAYSSGSKSIALCWLPPAQANGEILHYTLNIKYVELDNYYVLTEQFFCLWFFFFFSFFTKFGFTCLMPL